MLQFLKDIFAPLFTKYTGDWLETKVVPFVASISISVGCYMLTEQIIGALLISVPLIYFIYTYKESNSIKDKFVIRTTHVRFVTIKDVGKLYLILECENLSNQLIRCFANLEKSFLEVKVQNGAASLTQHRGKYYTRKHQLFPYSSKNLAYYDFHIEEVLKLARENNNTVQLYFNIVLHYGIMNGKCNQEAILSGKGNLKIELVDGKIYYKYTSNSKLLN